MVPGARSGVKRTLTTKGVETIARICTLHPISWPAPSMCVTHYMRHTRPKLQHHLLRIIVLTLRHDYAVLHPAAPQTAGVSMLDVSHL